MELNHDWRGFQAVFQPKRRVSLRPTDEDVQNSSMLFLVVEGTTVLSAMGAQGEDVSSWIGKTVNEVAAHFPNRELVLFTRKEVDQWMNGCLQLPHFYDQMEYLRTQSVPEAISSQGKVRKVRPVARRHFLLEAIQGWWSRILPSAYGIYIRLENANPSVPPQEIFLLVRRGKLDLFHTPDFSALGSDRAQRPAALVRYLAEKHMVPVQGLFIPAEDWDEWSDPRLRPGEERQAWRKLAFAIKDKRVRMVPFRWWIAVLGATKAFLGL